MSPVRPSGGESLQEMIDRYNRELLQMHTGARAEKAKPSPRPEPEEPLYNRGSFLPRPEPSEPLDQPHGRREASAAQPWSAEREQGLRDIQQGRRDREQGLRDIEQSRRDREQGLKDIEQGRKDAERGRRDGQPDILRELERLRNALRELERREREYRQGMERHQSHHPGAGPFGHPAVTAAAQPDSDREQWLRDLEQGRRDLEQGLRDLEQGWRDREQGVRDYEQGLAEREYWLEQSRPASSQTAAAEPALREMNPQNGDASVPVIPGRVTAQSLPAEWGDAAPEDGFGTLIVQVFTARRAEPVPGAQVVVTLPREDGELLFRVMTTDRDGRTPPLRLPVGAAADDSTGYTAPSVNYRVYVTADRFLPSEGLDAQIFSGITGVLPVELIPGEGAF